MSKVSKIKWWRETGVVPVFSMFFLEAFILGNWIPRIPDVKLLFGFSASQLGGILFVFAAGTLVSFLIGGQLLKNLGLARACAIALPTYAVGNLLVPLMPNGAAICLVLFCGGLGIGLLEIAMNTAADRLEKSAGRRLMSKAHGFWSLGSLFGALLGAGIAALGFDVASHFAMVLPLTAIVGAFLALRIPKAGAAIEKLAKSDKIKLKLPARGLILLCLMPVGIMMVEGAFIDWSALFVRDVLAGGALTSGLIFAAFSTVMAATRLSGDMLLDRFGPVRVARVSAVSATFGIVLFALSPNIIVAFIAALFAGLGTAVFYPLTMTAAAARPGDEEDNVAAMSLFAFTSFMLAPPLLGTIADVAGLRVALIVIAPLAIGSLLLSSELNKEN